MCFIRWKTAYFGFQRVLFSNNQSFSWICFLHAEERDKRVTAKLILWIYTMSQLESFAIFYLFSFPLRLSVCKYHPLIKLYWSRMVSYRLNIYRTDIWESQLQASEDVWISILKLSTMWFCLEMRDLAIKKLNVEFICKWTPAKMVLFGRRYFVDYWVRTGYRMVVVRNGAISDDEANEIGPLQCLRLMRLRESPRDFSHRNVDAEIQGAFRDELQKLVAKQKAFSSRKGWLDCSNMM